MSRASAWPGQGPENFEALVVKRHTAAGGQKVYGILTPEMVENAYLQ